MNVFSFTPQKKEIQIVKVAIDKNTGKQIIIAQVNGKEVYLQPFNINDNRRRKVVCISGDYGCTRGHIYTLTHVDVHNSGTYLSLKESTFTHHNNINFVEVSN